MPKTSKRAETKRAARIARAHATQPPTREVETTSYKRRPGYKPPARGIARYPWATAFILMIILVGIIALYYNHAGPFALAKKSTLASPCLQASVLKQITDTAAAPSSTAIAAIQHTYKAAPAMSINQSKTYCAGINTNRGLIVVELDPKLAPNTVNNFVFLAQHHFYDGLTFHRVLQTGTFRIIQSGDPTGTGSGGPGYSIPAEPVQGNYTAGTIAMAKPSTGTANSGSQFFIDVTNNTSSLQKQYNLFGHVVQGMKIVQSIQGPGDSAASKSIKPDVINHLIVVMAS